MITEDIVESIVKFVFVCAIVIAAIAVIGFICACAHTVLYGSHPKPFVIIQENIVDGKTIRTSKKEYRKHSEGLLSVNCSQCNNPELRDANNPIDIQEENLNRRNAATNIAIMSAGAAIAAGRRL